MTKYHIYGHEVDKETYEKYANMKFDINGQLKDLNVVKFWAHSKEIAEYCPEDAEAARAIYNEILHDIGAEDDAPAPIKKAKSFRGYVEKLNDVYKKYRDEYTSLQNAWNIADAEYKAAMSETGISEADALIAKGNYAQAEKTLSDSVKSVQSRCEEDIRELRKQFEEFAQSVYRATPNKMDTAAMQLINSGVMTVSDLEFMAEEQRHSPTMLKIIAQHAKKMAAELNNSKNYSAAKQANALAYKLEAVGDYNVALGGFDALVPLATGGLRANSAEANTYNEYWNTNFEKVCENYDSFWIQPREETGA